MSKITDFPNQTKSNSPELNRAMKHVASALIQDILREETNPENHCNQIFISNQLKARYGLSMTRQTVARHLNRLLEEDLYIVGDAQEGYYYDTYAYSPARFVE